MIVFLSVLFATDRDLGDIERAAIVESCIECHSDLLNLEVKHPVAEDACDNCHLPTGESHPEEGVRGFTLLDKIPDLCFFCHEEFGSPAYQHMPVSNGDCLSCHDAHGSSERALLRSEEQELCLSCHNQTYISDSSRTENIRQLVTGKQMEHSAITGGACIQCHKAHVSEFRSLLLEDYPQETYVEGGPDHFPLCFLCHDPDMIELEQTEWGTNFREGTRNLHHLHIKGNKGRNCRLCHNLHGSPQKYLVEERIAFGEWDMKMNFKPNENGGSCLPGCHGYQAYTR